MLPSHYYTGEAIETLVQGFSNKTLPKEKWTHEAHLATALWFLKHYDLHDATCRMKSGIISYNLSLGGENTGTNGYHETLTLFWMDVLHIFVQAHKNEEVAPVCNKLLSSPLADKNLPFIFYAKERLLSPVARARAIAPDIKEVHEATILPLAATISGVE